MHALMRRKDAHVIQGQYGNRSICIRDREFEVRFLFEIAMLAPIFHLYGSLSYGILIYILL
jgi:hypothetical protein